MAQTYKRSFQGGGLGSVIAAVRQQSSKGLRRRLPEETKRVSSMLREFWVFRQRKAPPTRSLPSPPPMPWLPNPNQGWAPITSQ